MRQPPSHRQSPDETRRLLARTPVIAGPCELDLLVFLHRHPRTLLTNEQLAAFVGYDMKRIADVVDAFMAAGLLERTTQTRNPVHAARMYLLVLGGPQGSGARAILELASARQGRQDILEALDAGGSRTGPVAVTSEPRRLHAIG